MQKKTSKINDKSNMKASSIVKYAWKNLFHNFSRSILALITVVLLAVSITFIGNFCLTLKATIDKNILDEVNAQSELAVVLIGEKIINSELIDQFQHDMQALKICDRYTVKLQERVFFLGDNTSEVPITAYRSGLKSNIEPEVLNGERWGDNDIGKKHIWLAEGIAMSANLLVGDSVKVSQNKIIVDKKGNITYKKSDENSYVIMGIVDGETSFVDVSVLPISSIYFSQIAPKYKNVSILDKISAIGKKYQRELKLKDPPIYAKCASTYEASKPVFGVVAGACLALIGLSVLLCIGCVLNTLKISIENNSQSIGIMRSLGMRNNDIRSYLFMQIIFIIIIAVVIATLIAWALGGILFPFLVGTIASMMFGASEITLGASFNMLIPIFSTLLLVLVVLIASRKMMKRYLKQSTISVLIEVAE